MPGTPMAKSHSFSSANCFTWRGVINCSASDFRSSGRSGTCSRAWSSPSTRIVGGRPTFRCRSEPLRRTSSCSTDLKFSPDAGLGFGDAGADVACGGLAIWIDLEQHLPVFDRLRVLHENLTDHARVL